MDPSSAAFTPSYNQNHSQGSNDSWRLASDVEKMRQVQAEHADRLARIERRQDEDGRRRSVYGSQSPFPSILSGGGLGTPMQSALQHPPNDQFRNFDDESNNMMSSLHLDNTDDHEPRSRLGAASRANSVRFDETANQNHFSSVHSHSSRASMDYMSRTPSGLGGLGGLAMNERSTSHKSDGRASSAHSIRSTATSAGRANSLILDSSFGLGGDSPRDGPALAPGLLLLGSVPAIIRCWMNTNFKHDALLYAAVCTGSYRSYLDIRLIRKLGFEHQVVRGADGGQKVDLPVYFPEAVPHPASSRSNSPAPQLPTLTVEFQVVDASSGTEQDGASESKAIQIFLGSDTLRANSADILYSSNSMTLFDDDRSKLSIPLVRPEDENSFNTLAIGSTVRNAVPETKAQPYLNGLGQGSSLVSSTASLPPPPGLPLAKYRTPGAVAAEAGATTSASGSDRDVNVSRPVSRQSTASGSRPALSRLSTGRQGQDASNQDMTPGGPSRAEGSTASGPGNRSPSLRASSGTSGGMWANSWRAAPGTNTTSMAPSTAIPPLSQPSAPTMTNPPQPAAPSLDWANVSLGRNKDGTANDASEKAWIRKRDGDGIRVLKPKSTSRTLSASGGPIAATPSASGSGFSGTSSPAGEGIGMARSRFFDEGRRRSGPVPAPAGEQEKKENLVLTGGSGTGTGTQKRSNPVGGASAFSWLNSGAGAPK